MFCSSEPKGPARFLSTLYSACAVHTSQFGYKNTVDDLETLLETTWY